MNKLVKALSLLNVINEQEMEFLDHVQILDQKIKNTKYIFTLLLTAPLPVALFRKICDVVYDDIQIEVKVVAVKKITHHDVKQYLEYIAGLNPDLKLFAKHVALDHFNFSHDEHMLTFRYAIENELDEIHQVVKSAIDLLKKAFGLPILDFETEINEEFQTKINSKKAQNEKKLQSVIEDHQAQAAVKKNVEEVKLDTKKIVPLNELLDGMRNVLVNGEVYDIEYKETNKIISFKFFINDYTSTFVVKHVNFKESSYNAGNFKKADTAIFKDIVIGNWICASVDIKTDKYEPEVYGQIKKLVKTKKPHALIRRDEAADKRVELTVHSKMSAFDGIIEIDELANTIKDLGFGVLPITDRYNIQSFPYIQKEAKAKGLKPIYGCEFCTLNHPQCVLSDDAHAELKKMAYVVFDLETTGLNPGYDDIIEFGGIKYADGIQTETLQFFIKPRKPVSDFTTELTGITQADVEHAISQEEGILKILNFIGDLPIIAHNAINFDYCFLLAKASKYLARQLKNTVIDTLHIVRGLYPHWKNHTLEKTCKEFKVNYEVGAAHRADYDANVLNACWNRIIQDLSNLNINYLDEINPKVTSERLSAMYQSDHTFIYVKNPDGLKKLNELISIAHTKHFYNIPRLPRQIVDANRQNLILAPSPIEGEVMRVALATTDFELKKAIAKYDYIFVAPLDSFLPYIKSNEMSEEMVKDATLRIIKFAIEQNKKVIAVSNAYYLNTWDKKYQEVYLYAKALNGRRHRFYRYKALPNQHIRSTQEMLDAFCFLNDEKLIYEIVVTNSHYFSDQIQNDIFPIKDRLYAPKMQDVNTKLTSVVYETAQKIYGPNLPSQVTERLERELNSIITHEFTVVYWVAYLLVKKSHEDGYPVGSRGSVGSSLVATMLKITDVNPLQPHYLCDQCKYCKFEDNIDDGFDLIPTKCPVCDGILRGEGHNIPFETFLGFKGDKTPDIDLNFSGVYQPIAHNFIKEIFGADHSFRAGTISTVAEKTCYSLVKSYFDELGELNMKPSGLSLYVKKCQNVKRTTGQHPGGILVIPSEYSVFDFTPYNFPADDTSSDWFTTHYAFEFLHDNLLKFDILGHDNPTILKRLKDLTGIDEQNVPNYDPKVLRLFTSIEPLNLDDEYLLDEKNGAISIPEFGTKFVREMLVDTQPSSFADLIRISGLSHGTNVYLGNAKELIKQQGLKLMNVIACRDDIMIYLIQKGLDPSMSFKIMEDVRKGKKLRTEYEEAMRNNSVPNWYIDSCNKIEYIFPKAHATAYVMHAWKFAWYKIYYPLPYYSIFFSTKADTFEIETILKGKHAIKNRMAQIKLLMENKETASQVKKKELDSLIIFEVCLEMLSRNFKISKPDIFMSDATEFVINNDTLIIPFNCVEGVGDDVARQLIEERNKKPFRSLDDVIIRTKLNRTSIAKLEELGAFDSLPKSDQLSLF